ncbi:protealysin inhibitor emfourin [Streptomyces sp. WM6372]|uniref:protealysin inhibitor emfourin n=1 Tax=Streptomyces sp. WM6372 TaxID=1415555 RepID=UPI0006AF0692|nr:protealysin inhibitor emfourin [Streptomyces sp. WM6372]
MKVTLVTHGGLAAAVNLRLPPKVLDTDTLPENAAPELARLVAAAVATPKADQPNRARDAMSYTITVEDGGRSTVLKQSDAAMTPAFADLLTRLQKYLEQQ